MTPLDEKLLAAVRKTIAAEMKADLLQAQRKLKRALQQRDEWAYKARYYREKLLERK